MHVSDMSFDQPASHSLCPPDGSAEWQEACHNQLVVEAVPEGSQQTSPLVSVNVHEKDSRAHVSL